MKNKQLYLCGKMGGLTYKEYTQWREQIKVELLSRCDSNVDLTIISPPDFFHMEETLHDNELEVMNWELNRVRNSNVVIANLNFNNSTGSNIEIYEAWRNNIQVVALWDKENYPQHPWIENMVTRTFKTMDELSDYVNYYHMV